MARVFLEVITGNLMVLPDSASSSTKSLINDEWNNDVDDAGGGAEGAVEFGQKIFKFGEGIEQTLRAKIKVPNDYAGGQLFAILSFYSPSIADSFKFSTRTHLQENAVDPADESANFHDSTNAELANSAPVNLIRKISFDLTDADSKINGILVEADDILDILLMRETIVGDDLEDLRFIPYAEIVVG